MIKRLFLYLLITFFSFSDIVKGEDFVSFGFHVGAQHNVGMLESYDPAIQIDPQNNYFLGISSKLNFAPLFIRFGIDIAFMINDGEVLENSSTEIESTKIQTISSPFFFGYNYHVLDIGNFYMGPGLSYIFGRGRIISKTPALSDDINATSLAFGFVAGIEFELSPVFRFYFEWNYLDGRSEPVQQTQTTDNWDNFYIDFSGHRILFGVLYYII